MTILQAEKKTTSLSEADKILLELQSEIRVLKDRMGHLEEENADRSSMQKELHFRREETQKLWKDISEQEEETAENFQILAEMMHDMKNPVNGVVENLSDLSSSIADEEVKQSLEDCMQTAQYVLDQFEQAEVYCQTLGAQYEGQYSTLSLRRFLLHKTQQLQNTGAKVDIFSDPEMPDEISVDTPLLNKAIDLIFSAFAEVLESGNRVEMKIYHSPDEQGYSAARIKIRLNFLADTPLGYLWRGSWKESLDISGDNEEGIPLSWLQCRNELKRAGGNLKIIRKAEHIFGTEILFPIEEQEELSS